MNKLYNKQTWHNNTTPAINEDNLNHIENGIDAIDSRLVEISGTLMDTIPEILEMYDDIETLTKNPPYIGTNGNWYVWDTETGAYVDSGVDASITVTIADVTMLPTGSQPYVTNTGTNTDPIFHLFIPYGGSTIGVTGVKGDAESTYRSGDVNLTKANIGLGNVDNTSDLNKPVSTATQTALSGKLDKSGGTITGDIVLGDNEGGGGSIEEEQGADWYIGSSQNPIHSGNFGDLGVSNDLDVGGDLDVSVDAGIGGDLSVGGNITATGRVNCDGVNIGTQQAHASGDLNVYTTFNLDGDAYIEGDLAVTRDITVRDITTEDGLEIVDRQGNLRFELDSDAEIDGTNVDTAPTSGSKHIVTSGGVYTALQAKQDKLTAGTGIAISGNNVITATGGGGSATKWYYITGGGNPIGTNIAHSFYTGGFNQTKFIEVRVLAPQSSAFTSLAGFISYIWDTGVAMLMQDKSNGSTTAVLWTRVGVVGGGYLLLVGEWNSYSTSFADNDFSRASYVLKVSPGMVDSLTDTVSSWGGGLYKHKIKIQFASPATYLARGGTHTKNGDYVIGYGKTEGIQWA